MTGKTMTSHRLLPANVLAVGLWMYTREDPFMSERYFTHTLNMVSKDVATIYGPNECIETV